MEKPALSNTQLSFCSPMLGLQNRYCVDFTAPGNMYEFRLLYAWVLNVCSFLKHSFLPRKNVFNIINHPKVYWSSYWVEVYDWHKPYSYFVLNCYKLITGGQQGGISVQGALHECSFLKLCGSIYWSINRKRNTLKFSVRPHWTINAKVIFKVFSTWVL